MSVVEVLDPVARARAGGWKVDMSRSVRNARVSSEWFNRPDDERYLSFDDLWAWVDPTPPRSWSRSSSFRPGTEPSAPSPPTKSTAKRSKWSLRSTLGNEARGFCSGRGVELGPGSGSLAKRATNPIDLPIHLQQGANR
jgi:hypothetical protein